MDESTLDHFCRTKGLRPVSRETTPYGDIFIAETDLEMDKPLEHPWGYYQTFYCLAGATSEGKMDVGQWLEFGAMHDKGQSWTPETKRKARIEATRRAALAFMRDNIEAGRYHA